MLKHILLNLHGQNINYYGRRGLVFTFIAETILKETLRTVQLQVHSMFMMSIIDAILARDG